VIGSTERRLTLGTDSEAARRDWAFSIMLATKFDSGSQGGDNGGKPSSQGVRDSLSYVNELKKQQSLLVALDGRNSIQNSGDAFSTSDMKRQSVTVDLPLSGEADENRLQLAAKAAKNAKVKRAKSGRLSESLIIKETDETKQEELSMMQRVLENDEEDS